MMHPADADTGFSTLVRIMSALRDPDGGCPWDLEQDFSSIATYTLEEAYEVVDAISRSDMAALKDELGDLLLQVVFHSQMAQEAGHFDVSDVVAAITDKMTRRHPHVFGTDQVRNTADEQKDAWEDQKAAERAELGTSTGSTGALFGVAMALPALTRAEKLQKRAARVGFDWPDAAPVFAKLDEEMLELKEAIQSEDKSDIEEEFGDLLFVVANLGRKLGIDGEVALRAANTKFERRFSAMEALAEQDERAFDKLALDEQEAYWTEVKKRERR